MEKEIFSKIEDESQLEKKSNEKDEAKESKPFVTGLPNWDLEPPYETIQRSNKK